MKTIAAPAASAAAMTSSSRTDPPGWMIDVTPASIASSGPSENGKNASDAFFPFSDGPELAMEAGVRSVIQPGGSVRDDEVIAAADAAGATMVFTRKRHFRH